MEQINYRSDFDFILVLKDAGGEITYGIPDFDWKALFYTSSKANGYTVSSIGGEKTSWYDDGGKIHVVVNNHHMGMGGLQVDFTAYLPDKIYPDGSQTVVTSTPLKAELVRGIGKNSSMALVVHLNIAKDYAAKDNTPLAIPSVITPGRISTCSVPGFLYRNLGAKVPIRGLNFFLGEDMDVLLTTNISRAFPNGKFMGTDITVEFSFCEGEYNRETGDVTVTHIRSSENGRYREVRVIFHGVTIHAPYLTVNNSGQIIGVNARPRLYNYNGADWCITAYDLMTMWEMFQDPTSDVYVRNYAIVWNLPHIRYYKEKVVRVDIQFRLKRKRKAVESDPDNPRHKDSWRWGRVHKMRRMGVMRVRLHSRRGYKSEWKYYAFCIIPSKGRALIRQIG